MDSRLITAILLLSHISQPLPTNVYHNGEARIHTLVDDIWQESCGVSAQMLTLPSQSILPTYMIGVCDAILTIYRENYSRDVLKKDISVDCFTGILQSIRANQVSKRQDFKEANNAVLWNPLSNPWNPLSKPIKQNRNRITLKWMGLPEWRFVKRG